VRRKIHQIEVGLSIDSPESRVGEREQIDVLNQRIRGKLM